MDIRGITKFTLVDYPGKIACILFVGNCNFRCPFCHNPYLVLYCETQPRISEKRIFAFLESRIGKIDGVVISGGEPAIYPNLSDFTARIKAMGFAIKLDTNGSFPERIISMAENGLIDMLGIDYKATAALYNQVAVSDINGLAEKVQSLIKYAVGKNIPYDIRTTVHKKILSENNLKTMRSELDNLGVKDWTLQQFHHTEVIDASLLEFDTYSDMELFAISRRLGENTHLRGVASK